jgi:hypothetical protein
MEDAGVTEECDAEWDTLVSGRTGTVVKRQWHLLVKRVPQWWNKSFADKLKALSRLVFEAAKVKKLAAALKGKERAAGRGAEAGEEEVSGSESDGGGGEDTPKVSKVRRQRGAELLGRFRWNRARSSQDRIPAASRAPPGAPSPLWRRKKETRIVDYSAPIRAVQIQCTTTLVVNQQREELSSTIATYKSTRSRH